MEVGGEYDRYTDTSHGVLTPVTAKLGVTSHTQLTIQGGFNALPGGGTLGLGDVSVGVKWRLLNHAPILGDFAVLPSVKLPTGSEPRTICPVAPPCFLTAGRGIGTTDVGLVLISSHVFGSVAVDLNLGYVRRSGDGSAAPKDATVWTASFGGLLSGALGWVAELSGRPGTSGPAGQANTVAFLAGPTFACDSWLTADVGGSIALTGPQPDALYAGMTVNVGRVFR
jgi:hypothetical protein